MTEEKYSLTYYSLFCTSVIGVIGSGAYIYSVFKNKNYQDKTNSSRIDSDISLTYKGELTTERALKLMAILHNKTEQYILSKKPNIDEERRNKIGNLIEYEKVCEEILSLKNDAFIKITNSIREKYGYTYEDISKVLDSMGPIEMEEKLLKYSSAKFDSGINPDKKIVEAAFTFYGKRCIEEMKKIHDILNKNVEKQEKEFFVYQLMILKYRVDDELFLKFGFTEYQMKYLLFEYKLHKEPQVLLILKEISVLEELFS